MAVELKEPALRLMTWIENNRQPELADRFIEDLMSRPLEQIADDPYVVEPLGPSPGPAHTQHRGHRGRWPSWKRGSFTSTSADQNIGAFNKFITYYLFPEARYSVGGDAGGSAPRSRSVRTPGRRFRAPTRSTRSASGYGGGGHPVVGAVSLPGPDTVAARRIADEIIARLQGG